MKRLTRLFVVLFCWSRGSGAPRRRRPDDWSSWESTPEFLPPVDIYDESGSLIGRAE